MGAPVAAALCALLLAALPAPAQAQGPLDQPLTTASDVLCPPVSEVGALLDEHAETTPLGGIGAGLTSLVCSADLLQFDFFTRWTAADGSRQTRTTRAVVGAPTPIEADGDPTPDLIGTLTLTDPNTLAMVVERAPGETATLPVSVEGVLTDRSKQVLGRERLAFGYDARHDRAPGRFSLSTPVDTLLRPQGQYRFDVAQQDRGERIALIGALFDGGIANRRNPSEVRLAYGASPDQATVRAATSENVAVTLTTNRPGPAELSGRIVDGAREDRAVVALEDLPNELTLGLDTETGTVTYDASAPMNRLAAEVDTADPAFLNARHFEATLLSVPQSFSLSVGQEASNLTLEADEPIGQIDFRARSDARQYPELPAGEAGATVDATAGELALALRVFELRRLAVSLDPVVFEAQMRGGQTFTIDARLDGEGGPTEADIVFDPLPAEISFTVDSDTGQVAYTGSAPMNRLFAAVHSAQPLLLEATDVEATLLDVPSSFTLDVGDSNGFELVSGDGIGTIDIRAHSANRAFPEIPAGEAGAILDATGNELAVALRVFELRRLAVSPDPLLFETDMRPGRFTLDARLDTDSGPVHAAGLIDELPAQFSAKIEDIAAPRGGSALTLTGSDRIGFVGLTAEGFEFVPGADTVELAINDLPTSVTVELPDNGELAKLVANDPIGQIRIAASGAPGALPARSYLPGDPVADDLFRFRDVPGDFAIGVRLTAVSEISVDLDPVNITLKQDPAKTRAIDLDAAFNTGSGTADIEGELDKPHASTSISVLLGNGPTTIVLDNSANMGRLELHADGIGSVSSADVTFTNLSRRLSLCIDPGPGCQRSSPNGNLRVSPTKASIDFDDFGTQNPGQFTTLNAHIGLSSGPVTITNLRFRNLAMDFGDSGQTDSCLGARIPKVHVFFDSRNQPFVMNSVKLPPTIDDFRIGSDGSPASANHRAVRVNGWNSFCGGINTSRAGSLTCGGQRVLRVNTALGTINLLDFLGFQLVPLCTD